MEKTLYQEESLALTEEGITLHRGTDDRELLAACPVETWAFFENCAIRKKDARILTRRKQS